MKKSSSGRNSAPVEKTWFPRPGRTAAEDTVAVMKHYGLPAAFPRAVISEAKTLAGGDIELRGRRDLRKKFIFTCDPVTAKDYDDALSFETDRRGNRILGVHIADVSHYVRPGSAIDREAQKRSTSVYFCDRVVPMLPEILSNGLCSLVPGEDRLAFSVFMTFDGEGEMIKREFCKSVIRSQARFTYEEVMRVIGGSEKVKGRSEKAKRKELRLIREINALAQQLRARRFSRGALDLAIPEAEIVLDRFGELESIMMRENDESHQMIEECMVAANEAVAKELWTNGVRILARLHEPPEEEKLLLLRAELRGLGVKMGDISKPRVFAQFLQSIKKHPLYGTIAMMILRSMKKAVYDPRAIGHFGLSKRYYAHFTSPIRRYPDLTLHRQLADYLVSKPKAKRPPKLLQAWADHANEMEEKAAEAERALAEIKKYRYLEEFLNSRTGMAFDAIISKCMPFGCFVEIPEIAVSGLVHVSLLSRKFVRFNESDQTLSAPGGGSWRVGDRIKVAIAAVDYDNRRLDFVPVSDPTLPRTSGRRNGGRRQGNF